MLAPSTFYPAVRDAVAVPVWWTNIQHAWRAKWGETACRQWLQDIVLEGWQDPILRLHCPRKLTIDWLQAQERGDHTLLAVVQQVLPTCRQIDLTTHNAPSDDDNVLVAPQINVSAAPPSLFLQDLLEASVAPVAPVMLTLNLEPRYNFDSFIVDASNELTYAAAKRVATSADAVFNPLFLHGGVGLGKTHLLHALGWAIRQNFPEKTVLYLSAEQFMYRFVRALRDKDMMAFKEQCRTVDVLMIDDLQFIAGKEQTQEEFFHTFNALIDQRKQIVLSADKSPHNLHGIDTKLRSRLGWGLVVDIQPSTYELRLGILQAKAAATDTHVPTNVLDYLARHITSNIRELEGALHRLLAHAELINRPITLDAAKELLPDLLHGARRKITVEQIQDTVAAHFKLDTVELLSAKRDRHLARPRQIAMSLAKQLTTLSLPDLGRAFGGRDHTTVLHAVRKIEELRSADADLAGVLDHLSQNLRYGG